MSIDVIGTGLGGNGLLPGYRHLLETAEVVAGGERMLEMTDGVGLHVEKIVISRDIEAFCRQILTFHEARKRVVVLADGDPLFFSIGNSLAKRAGAFRRDVHFWPNVSSLQGAASAMGIGWENIQSVSLHGRTDWWPLWHALFECGVSCSHVCVLTGGSATPAEIARELLARGVRNCEATVVEMLGTDSQKIRTWPLEDLGATEDDFETLNVLVLHVKELCQPVLGTPDPDYHSDGGLITKKGVRAIGLAELRLQPYDVLWDIGAGSGAVSIEAAGLVRCGQIFAIERNETRIRHIAANRAEYGAWLVEIVQGNAPAACENLPRPNKIFIGGGLGTNQEAALELLRYLACKLQPRGRLVVSCVLLASLECVRHFLTQTGWSFETHMVQIAQTVPLAQDCRFQSTAQVWLISAEKPGSMERDRENQA